MHRFVLFVFNGDPVCLVHVLLNALEMRQRGHEARIVVEGAATRLIPELESAAHPLHALWQKVLANGQVDGVCKACAGKMGTLAQAQSQGLALLSDMSGHPGMAAYRERGFEILTF